MYLINKIKLALQEDSITGIMRRFIKYYWKYLYYPYCLFELRMNVKIPNEDIKLEKYFNFAFRRFGGLIKPSQIESEFKQLFELLEKRKIKNFLEIGTATGGTLFLFSKIADPTAKIISIDLPGGYFGGGYSAFKVPLYKSFARGNQKIKLIRKDSHLEETYNELKLFLDEEHLDFIFIDGDHSYEGVKKDFYKYSGLLGQNGVIAFHDIAKGGELAGNVFQFWSEVKNNYANLEFINNIDQKGCGIGILFLTNDK